MHFYWCKKMDAIIEWILEMSETSLGCRRRFSSESERLRTRLRYALLLIFKRRTAFCGTVNWAEKHWVMGKLIERPLRKTRKTRIFRRRDFLPLVSHLVWSGIQGVPLWEICECDGRVEWKNWSKWIFAGKILTLYFSQL